MVRFGILGAGNIAHRFAQSLAHEPRASLVAASCRTQEKAEAFLSEVPHAKDARAYASYDQLLGDPAIDAIYLALPHALHCKWAVRALNRDKAVLCEKPATLYAAEMSRIADVARSCDRLFMEAMKPRFVPLYVNVIDALELLGPIHHIEATLCNDMLGMVEGSGSYHMSSGPGSGVLLDCGIYCASWITAFCPEPLSLTSCESRRVNGIDVYANALLAKGPVMARLECAFDRAKPRTATLVGERGRLVVEELHRPTRAILYLDDMEPRTIDAPYEVDDFFGEIRHFVDLVEEEKSESPIMSLSDSIACAALLDTIRSAVDTND